MRAAVLLLFALGSACGGAEPPSGAHELSDGTPSSRDTDEAGSTRASRERAEVLGVPTAVAPEAPPVLAAPRPLVTVTPITVEQGEDGRGSLVSASRAVAVDLDARRFPPRALDPVLHVGDLRFTRYTHPRPYVLRFVVADAALLVPGAEAFVQHGDDPSTRVDLPSLEVPR